MKKYMTKNMNLQLFAGETITDLAGTKWVLNNIINISVEGEAFNINFTSNNTNFTILSINSKPRMYYAYNDYEVSILTFDSSGWSDSAYRVISITDGTDVTNSTLISWLQNNAVQVPVIDLTGTEWEMNSVINGRNDYTSFSINFTSNSTNYSSLTIDSESEEKLYYDNTVVYRFGDNNFWLDNSYKTIAITSGSAISNPNLIVWLSQNAVYQEPAPAVTYTAALTFNNCYNADNSSMNSSGTQYMLYGIPEGEYIINVSANPGYHIKNYLVTNYSSPTTYSSNLSSSNQSSAQFIINVASNFELVVNASNYYSLRTEGDRKTFSGPYNEYHSGSYTSGYIYTYPGYYIDNISVTKEGTTNISVSLRPNKKGADWNLSGLWSDVIINVSTKPVKEKNIVLHPENNGSLDYTTNIKLASDSIEDVTEINYGDKLKYLYKNLDTVGTTKLNSMLSSLTYDEEAELGGMYVPNVIHSLAKLTVVYNDQSYGNFYLMAADAGGLGRGLVRVVKESTIQGFSQFRLGQELTAISNSQLDVANASFTQTLFEYINTSSKKSYFDSSDLLNVSGTYVENISSFVSRMGSIASNTYYFDKFMKAYTDSMNDSEFDSNYLNSYEQMSYYVQNEPNPSSAILENYGLVNQMNSMFPILSNTSGYSIFVPSMDSYKYVYLSETNPYNEILVSLANSSDYSAGYKFDDPCDIIELLMDSYASAYDPTKESYIQVSKIYDKESKDIINALFAKMPNTFRNVASGGSGGGSSTGISKGSIVRNLYLNKNLSKDYIYGVLSTLSYDESMVYNYSGSTSTCMKTLLSGSTFNDASGNAAETNIPFLFAINNSVLGNSVDSSTYGSCSGYIIATLNDNQFPEPIYLTNYSAINAQLAANLQIVLKDTPDGFQKDTLDLAYYAQLYSGGGILKAGNVNYAKDFYCVIDKINSEEFVNKFCSLTPTTLSDKIITRRDLENYGCLNVGDKIRTIYINKNINTYIDRGDMTEDFFRFIGNYSGYAMDDQLGISSRIPLIAGRIYRNGNSSYEFDVLGALDFNALLTGIKGNSSYTDTLNAAGIDLSNVYAYNCYMIYSACQNSSVLPLYVCCNTWQNGSDVGIENLNTVWKAYKTLLNVSGPAIYQNGWQCDSLDLVSSYYRLSSEMENPIYPAYCDILYKDPITRDFLDMMISKEPSAFYDDIRKDDYSCSEISVNDKIRYCYINKNISTKRLNDFLKTLPYTYSYDIPNPFFDSSSPESAENPSEFEIPCATPFFEGNIYCNNRYEEEYDLLYAIDLGKLGGYFANLSSDFAPLANCPGYLLAINTKLAMPVVSYVSDWDENSSPYLASAFGLEINGSGFYNTVLDLPRLFCGINASQVNNSYPNFVAITGKYVSDSFLDELITKVPTTLSDEIITKSVLDSALANVQPSLTVDSSPTSASTNPVSSGGVYTALSGKQNSLTNSSVSSGNVSQVIGFDSNGSLARSPMKADSVAFLSEPPTQDNTDGLKFVVLSTEPATRYNGYLYIITS